MLSLLIFVLGAVVVLLGYEKAFIWAIIVGMFALLCIYYQESILNVFYKDREFVIKKICFVYVTIELFYNDGSNNRIKKTILRVIKELAIDICGRGYLSQWIKWQAYFMQEYKKKAEEEKSE